VCNWVRASQDARSPNVMRDKYGFMLANFNQLVGKVHSFAFSLHCQQVFFSNDPNRRGWKVVCRTDVRGRKKDSLFLHRTSQLLEVGNDADFVGLQAPITDADMLRVPLNAGGAYIRMSTRRQQQ